MFSTSDSGLLVCISAQQDHEKSITRSSSRLVKSRKAKAVGSTRHCNVKRITDHVQYYYAFVFHIGKIIRGLKASVQFPAVNTKASYKKNHRPSADVVVLNLDVASLSGTANARVDAMSARERARWFSVLISDGRSVPADTMVLAGE